MDITPHDCDQNMHLLVCVLQVCYVEYTPVCRSWLWNETSFCLCSLSSSPINKDKSASIMTNERVQREGTPNFHSEKKTIYSIFMKMIKRSWLSMSVKGQIRWGWKEEMTKWDEGEEITPIFTSLLTVRRILDSFLFSFCFIYLFIYFHTLCSNEHIKLSP